MMYSAMPRSCKKTTFTTEVSTINENWPVTVRITNSVGDLVLFLSKQEAECLVKSVEQAILDSEINEITQNIEG